MTGPRTALKLGKNYWRSRWLVLPTWNCLHRIAEIDWEGEPMWGRDERVAGIGVAVCGAHGRFFMPGILSRMGLTRCAHCCDALGIPRGDGAPMNVLEGKAQSA